MTIPPREKAKRRQQIYERVEALKAQGLRSDVALKQVAGQLGMKEGAVSNAYYTYRRKDLAVAQLPPQVAKERAALAEQVFVAVKRHSGVANTPAVKAAAQEHKMSVFAVRCYYDAHRKRATGPTDEELAQARELEEMAEELRRRS